MIGLDTGFFLELLKGRSECIEVWTAGLNDEIDIAVSCISLFEIERLGLKGKIGSPDVILESIKGMCEIVRLDDKVLSLGAKLCHGLGMPALDSLILACLVSANCTEIFTTDSDFEAYHSSRLVIRNLHIA